MKAFKKKRSKLPKQGAIPRLLRKFKDEALIRKFNRGMAYDNGLPRAMREVTLATLDLNKRGNITYYPDLKAFMTMPTPNRSMPADKFIGLFRGMLPQSVIDATLHTLTNYRLEFYVESEDWIMAYNDDNVHSCMSQSEAVALYAHPENKLALAVLYAPGTNRVVARTIVNTEEKWYVRLFGDALLLKRLNELGYTKLSGPPGSFKMYGQCAHAWQGIRDTIITYPYFDFACLSLVPNESTFNPVTRKIEVIINGDTAR